MVIREPVAADAAAIAEVRRLATAALRMFYRPRPAALARRAARATIRRQLVCEIDGRVTGTVDDEDRGDCRHICGLSVHPDFQRRGIARALLERLATDARAAGQRALSLYTIKQTGNVAIFSRLGFAALRETPDDPEIFENLTDEALVDVYMERPLG
jgi:N-acetylglutamate synthase-like GNAT family acetyltransferase